jgi:hypothetical protein
VVSRFSLEGSDYVVIAAKGSLLVRDALAITETNESRLGFGDVDDAMASEVADLILPTIRY